MSKTFIISDLHLGHQNICKFVNSSGDKVRPWDNVDDMNEALIANWNSVVTDNDRVIVAGDVTINKKHLHLIGRCHGKKVLVKGNHDNAKIEEYLKYFYDVRACMEYDKVIITHIPVHHSQKTRYAANLHGHTHNNLVCTEGGFIDPWYINICVEKIGYTPKLISEVLTAVAPNER